MEHDPRVNFILLFFGEDLVRYSVGRTLMNKTSIFLADVGLPRGKYSVGIHEDKRMGEIVFHSPVEENERIYFAYIERFSKWRLYIDSSTQCVRLSILSSSDTVEVTTEPYCSDLVVFLCQLAVFASLDISGRNFAVLTRAVDLFQFVDFESGLNLGLNLGLNNLIQLRGEIHELITQQPDEMDEVKSGSMSFHPGDGREVGRISQLLVPEYYKLLPILINFMDLEGSALSMLAASVDSSAFQQYDAEGELERQLAQDLLCSVVLHRNAPPEMLTAMTRHGDPVVRATAMLALRTSMTGRLQGKFDAAPGEGVQDRIYMIPEECYVAVPEIPEAVRQLEREISQTILEQLTSSRA